MRNLFRPPSEALTNDLTAALQAIAAATPLSKAHGEKLPYAVKDLSRLLTQDRSQLSSSYWINKRLLTAYCRYFLPWNLLRLSWMLPNLDLEMVPGATVLDLGSGPLTMPIALWLTHPAWRDLPVTVICADVAPGPLALGKEIFQRLAGKSPWKIELRRGPMEKTLREFPGGAVLICAANVLNETKPSRETPLQERLESLTRGIAARLAPEGKFLAVEPGTRLGGKLMALTRLAAFGSRLVPEVPCPHWGPCPMLAERATGWCHFSHTTDAVPRNLASLSRKAGFEKQSVSLSCLLLRKATPDEVSLAARHLPRMEEDALYGDDYEPGESGAGAWAKAFAASAPASPAFVRVLSDPIRLPDCGEPARYGCSEKGLVLARNALRLPSGAAFAAEWPSRKERDPKSGALILAAPSPGNQPDGGHAAKPARAPHAPAGERHKAAPPRGRRPASGKSSPGKADAARRRAPMKKGDHHEQ